MEITDLHMHIVPAIDDGSESIEMSVELLRSAYAQGARSVFCTSHIGYIARRRNKYLAQLDTLRRRLAEEKLDIRLFSGSELFVEENNIYEALQLLEEDSVFSLNGTRYVLTEFNTKVGADEARYVLKKLIGAGRKPVIAHAERCRNLEVPDYEAFAAMGCLIQINAYSFVEEHNTDTKTKARELLSRRLVSFIGSDAHTSYHRPPKYTSGVQYILETCDAEYAEAILYANANRLLLKEV